MRRLITAGRVALAVVGVVGGRTAAAQQQLVISLGGFSPRAEDARSTGDVLVGNRKFLDFNISDLSGPTIGGEWLVNLGDHFEAGLGASFYQRSTPSEDRFSTFSTGAPILARGALDPASGCRRDRRTAVQGGAAGGDVLE